MHVLVAPLFLLAVFLVPLLLYFSVVSFLFVLLTSTTLVYNSGPYFLRNFLPVWCVILCCVIEYIFLSASLPAHRLMSHLSSGAVLTCCCGCSTILHALASISVVDTAVSSCWCLSSCGLLRPLVARYPFSFVNLFFFCPPLYVEHRPCNVLVIQLLFRCYQSRVVYGSPDVGHKKCPWCKPIASKWQPAWLFREPYQCTRWFCRHLAFVAASGQMRR